MRSRKWPAVEFTCWSARPGMLVTVKWFLEHAVYLSVAETLSLSAVSWAFPGSRKAFCFCASLHLQAGWHLCGAHVHQVRAGLCRAPVACVTGLHQTA